MNKKIEQQIEKLESSKPLDRPQTDKKFKIGERVKAEYANGNKKIIFEGVCTNVGPQRVEIKDDHGEVKEYSHRNIVRIMDLENVWRDLEMGTRDLNQSHDNQ